MEFFATCPTGFEHLLAGELSSLGIEGPRALKGQVAWTGPLEGGLRACLWSRLASRVALVLARVGAGDSDELYEGVSSIPWTDHLPEAATLAIDAHGTNANLRNTQFLALRTKDAIADQLLSRRGTRPVTDTSHPDLRVVVRLREARATVGIDLSGEALFRRGGRRLAGRELDAAPLRADYAAALLAAGAWYRRCRQDGPTLFALYGGSGSVLVEAAEEAADRAPGLLRPRWGFEGWLGHDASVWNALLDEADERAERGKARLSTLSLLADDPRRGTGSACRAALRAAGLDAEVRLGPDAPDAEALATVDLSWLGADDLAEESLALGRVSRLAATLAPGSTISGLARGGSLAATLGQEPASAHDVIAGTSAARIEAFSVSADMAAGSRPTVTLKDGTVVAVMVGASDQFAARLAKTARLRAKWARREDVSCYRVYDADLPDYAVSLDLYQGVVPTPGRWLVAAEYAAPKGIDPGLAHDRLLDVLAIAPAVLGVAPSDVYLRTRERARGGSQYAETGRPARRDERRGRRSELPAGSVLVDEGGLTFEVNLAARLDTGLFLDTRDVRARIREMAKATAGSKRFLNLFAYTGTATCYAADGGAKHTTTVDLSNTYLEVARRNMARNGFFGREHEFVRADVVGWVAEQRHTANRWDLVYCDPPTFSNSSGMRGSSFDVQRDHAELLIGISRLLTRAGVCVFSCNLRGFKPDAAALAKAGVVLEDITDETIPEDFSRNARIHRCYLVRRG
ncbi:MAG: class I SAM-dependent methyltransferase [Atopobiaceae bacterium]|jgi:23S rRNA (guanine2445-N2)-methyltransferase / 23S rRNA (guanine2069-N7)-methyltransferase|nr:class I SAM-dependent methyltransferase [Atopobiaceae bacterium]